MCCKTEQCTEAQDQRFPWAANFSLLILKLFQHQTGLLPRQSDTFSSANDQTLVIAKMPLTSLGLYVSHQTIPLCLLPGMPMLHASHKVCVQDELLLGVLLTSLQLVPLPA